MYKALSKEIAFVINYKYELIKCTCRELDAVIGISIVSSFFFFAFFTVTDFWVLLSISKMLYVILGAFGELDFPCLLIPLTVFS